MEWCYLGSNGLRDPFFDYTMGIEVQTPFNTLFRFRTPVEALAEWRTVSPGVAPAGFIFHLSRCGSTLITQMLASLPENVVLSKPGVVDAMIRAGRCRGEAQGRDSGDSGSGGSVDGSGVRPVPGLTDRKSVV